MLAALLVVATCSTGALLPTPATTTDRLAVRSELLRLLPSGAPRPLAGRAADLVAELELLEAVPATPSFLALGVSGQWELRAVQASLEHAEAPSASSALPPAVEVLEVRQELDMPTEKARGLVRFRLADDALVGSLELDAIAALNAERCDTLNYVTTSRQLSLPRTPSCGVAALMEALHAGLSHDFLGDEGVRLGLQTTYVDEALRITRCTTRALAGSCAVHVRASQGTQTPHAR